MVGEGNTFLRYLNAQPKLIFRPSLFALAPFLLSLVLYPPNFRVLKGFSAEGMATEWLTLGMCIACLAASIIIALYASKKPSWRGFGRRVLLAAAVVYVVVQALVWTLLLRGHENTVLLSCLGVVLGISAIPIIMAWIDCFALDFRNIMLYGAVACIGATVLAWVISLMPGYAAFVTWMICAILGAASPSVLFKKRASVRCADAPGPTVDLSDSSSRLEGEQAASLFGSFKNLLATIGLPFLGFLVCMFITSSYEIDWDGLTLQSEFVGGVIASVIVIVLCLVQHKTPFVMLVEKVVVPTLVGVSVLMGSFPKDGIVNNLGAMSVFAPMIFLSIFALASLVAIVAAREFSLPFVFGTAFSLCNFALIAGTLCDLRGISSGDAGPLLWVIICTYFVLVVINLGYSSWNQLTRPSEDEGLDSDRSKLDPQAVEEFGRQRIERLSKEYGLTNRERELLGYLSRGYGSAFIAKNLFISDNTVRTHIRNIYRKLGVASREELLSLFNDVTCGVS